MARLHGRQHRRQFLQGSLALAGLGLISGCAIFPPQAQQPPKIPLIGWLSGSSPDQSRSYLEALRQGLREHGYEEGQNIAFEYGHSEGEDGRLPELAAELVGLGVNVIIGASSTPANLAAKRATASIPIVMVGVGDPIGAGLVESLSRPGGNVTGLTNLGGQLSAKRLELLKELVPQLSRVAFLWNSANPAQALGLTIPQSVLMQATEVIQ